MKYFNIIRKRVLEIYLMELENAYDIVIRGKKSGSKWNAVFWIKSWNGGRAAVEKYGEIQSL